MSGINEVAREMGASAAAVALAWGAGHAGNASTPRGARRMDQFEANLRAPDVKPIADPPRRLGDQRWRFARA